jgi:hypothetical protein
MNADRRVGAHWSATSSPTPRTTRRRTGASVNASRPLETRLSEMFGDEVAAELSGQGVLVAEKSLRDGIDALQAKVGDLKDELRRTNEDLQVPDTPTGS